MMRSSRELAIQFSMALINYFLDQQASHVSVEYEIAGNQLSVTVSGPIAARPADLDEMTAALHEPRQPEMDAYYDHLIGNRSGDRDFHLLGALVDEAEVSYANGLLRIKIGQASPLKN
jgi:hypothetical protein